MLSDGRILFETSLHNSSTSQWHFLNIQIREIMEKMSDAGDSE